MISQDLIDAVADDNVAVLGSVPAWSMDLVTLFAATSSGQAMANAVVNANLTSAMAATANSAMMKQITTNANAMAQVTTALADGASAIAAANANALSSVTNAVGVGATATAGAIGIGLALDAGLGAADLAAEGIAAAIAAVYKILKDAGII